MLFPRRLASRVHQIEVANQVDRAKLSQVAVLLGSQQISRAANAQILLGDGESIQMLG